MRHAAILALVLLLAGCAAGGQGFFDRLFGHHAPPPPPAPIRYVVGAPYQALGVWRYPQERFAGDETGLAAVIDGPHAPRTTDNEAFDQTAMAAAHPTLQLPALVRVTNLETGRQVLLRVNDRGPVPPGRVIGLTRHAAELIGARDGTQLRIEIAEAETRQLAGLLDSDSGRPAIAAAPTGAVGSETLAPPPGIAQGRARVALPGITVAPAADAAPAVSVPLRLPEQVVQLAAQPGTLAVVAGTFGRPEYAEIQRRRIAALGASVATSYNGPRDRAYRVQIGPLGSVAEADAMLARATASGIADARIVVQ